MLNETHDARAASWVPAANDPHSDFPLQNLPLCVFSRTDGQARIGVGIGDQILDLAQALSQDLLAGLDPAVQSACRASTLNRLFALGRPALSALRSAVWHLLESGAPQQTDTAACLAAQQDARFGVPCEIGDYTDFFTSFNHADNCAKIMRAGLPVSENFHQLPIAYHGRASSVVASGTPVLRPRGQWRDPQSGRTAFGPSTRLDFELEVAMYIGPGNARGQSIPIDEAENHLAGFSLLNDWSARDIQMWEAQPLGPFLGKNFQSTVSPWVVTLDALAPFRTPPPPREADLPALQDYLQMPAGARGFDLRLEAHVQTSAMRAAGAPAVRVSASRFARDCNWNPQQMIAHHTVNGCNLRPGDLLGSGTVSGPEPGTEGCLLERTRGGRQSITLPNGESLGFLRDGDEVILSAYCEAEGARRIGFGSCTGRVVAAG